MGSAVGSLAQTPPGQDTASRVGSKSQRFTTWNCISRTYVGSVTIAEAGERDVDPPVVVDRREEFDVPTPEELNAMSEGDRMGIESGAKVFLRGRGALTRRTAQGINRRNVAVEARVEVGRRARRLRERTPARGATCLDATANGMTLQLWIRRNFPT